jgi:outer membrane receptor protein involved in Fe transport
VLQDWVSQNGYGSLWELTPSGGGHLVFDAAALPGGWGDQLLLTVGIPSTLPPDQELVSTVSIEAPLDPNASNNGPFSQSVRTNEGSRPDLRVDKRWSYGQLVKGGRASYNLAAFYSDYTDQQITRQEPTSTGVASFVDNAGSSTIQGVELEGAIAFTEAWSLTYGAGWTDAEFDEYQSFTVVSGTPVPIDLADLAHFQNTPEWNGNVALTYVQPLAAGWGSLASMVSASYRDSYYMFEFDRPLIDQTTDYTLLDASITWTSASDKPRVQLAGRNLTDEEYKIGGYDFYTGYSAATQALYGNVVNSFYGPPRTYSLSASYRFD